MASGVDGYLKVINEYLKTRANRCLLILISDTQLNEDECRECLVRYGHIKEIQLTSDCRVAFVDFKCEHAPLLVIRCSSYHPNPKLPLPKGSELILPGCGYQNYLLLRDVPRLLSTAALQKHFTNWNIGHEVVIHRPDSSIDSSRVLIKFNHAGIQQYYNRREYLIRIAKDEQGNDQSFLTIPTIPELFAAEHAFDTNGCTQCNAPQLRADIVPPPVPVMSEQEWKECREELKKSTGLKSISRRTLVLISDTQLDMEECIAALVHYGFVIDIQCTSDSRAAFVDFACEHAPQMFARCFDHYKKKPGAPVPIAYSIPKGLLAVLPGCSIVDFLYLYIPDSLSSDYLKGLISDWAGTNVTVYRTASSTNLSPARAVVQLHGARIAFHELMRFIMLSINEQLMSFTVRFNGSCYCIHAIPYLPQLTSDVFEMNGCEGCKLEKLRLHTKIEKKPLRRRSK